MARAGARAAREVDRLLQSAALARVLGDLDAAAEALDRAHELLPWRMDVLTSLADVALEREGHEAVVARVERAYAASPHEGAILVELVGWLRGHDDERRIELIRARVDARPDDHWARRELALAHAALGDQDTALELARDAVSRTPANSIAHGVLGGLLVRAGETEEGRASLRRAVELWVDNTSAIRELTSIGGDAEAEREDVRFLLDQLDRRVSAGPGVIEAAYAAGALPRGERLERMERLLSMAAHRPDAWEAVARARMNAGDIDEADELCARACERFPRWFQLRRLQAEVHRVSGDADAEEAALSELVELSPTWTDPRARLAQLTRARGAIEEARQVIEEGLRRTPRSAALRSELAALEWAEGERERAVDVLLAALDDGAMDDPMYRRLVGFARHLGRADEVEARLRAQTEARPRAGQPWFRLAELLVEPARAEDRLEAAREAFRRSPRHADAVDLVAMTLAEMGRYADALDACPPPEWVGPTPYTMVGRRAWVQWRMGQRDDAIEAMRAILAEVPDYAWGRQQLCDWLDFLGRREEFRAEATLLVREGPTVGQHHVYLADARRLTGDLSGAVESYERALELAPSHDYAAAQLVDVLLEQGEVDDAEDALERLQHTLRAADARHGAVRVAAARGHWDDALDALDALVSEDAPEVLVRAALQAFGGGPRFDAALARVEARFTDPDAPEAFGYAWADAARDAAPLGRVVRLRDAMGAAGMAAVSASLEHLAKAGHRWRLLWLALRHGGWLRRADDTWAAFGLALQLLGYNRIALWWLRDREARPEAKPWMLLTVVLSAWWLGRRALAEAAVSQALAAPRDHTSDRHAVWALFHRALRGEPIVEDLDALPAVGTEIGVLHLVDALRQAAALPDASDDDLVRAVRPCIAAAEALEPADGLLLEPIEKTVDHIVGDRPGPVFSRLRRAANE